MTLKRFKKRVFHFDTLDGSLKKGPHLLVAVNLRKAKGNVTNMKGVALKLTGNLSGLRGLYLGLIEGNATNLFGDASKLIGDVSGLKGDCSNIFGFIGGSSVVKSLLSLPVVQAVSTSLNAAGGLGTVASAGVNALEDFLKTKKALKGDCSNITGNVTFINGDCSKLRGDVSWIMGDVSKISGDPSQLKGDVSKLSGDVTGLAGLTMSITGDCTNIYGDIKLELPKPSFGGFVDGVFDAVADAALAVSSDEFASFRQNVKVATEEFVNASDALVQAVLDAHDTYYRFSDINDLAATNFPQMDSAAFAIYLAVSNVIISYDRSVNPQSLFYQSAVSIGLQASQCHTAWSVINGAMGADYAPLNFPTNGARDVNDPSFTAAARAASSALQASVEALWNPAGTTSGKAADLLAAAKNRYDFYSTPDNSGPAPTRIVDVDGTTPVSFLNSAFACLQAAYAGSLDAYSSAVSMEGTSQQWAVSFYKTTPASVAAFAATALSVAKSSTVIWRNAQMVKARISSCTAFSPAQLAAAKASLDAVVAKCAQVGLARLDAGGNPSGYAAGKGGACKAASDLSAIPISREGSPDWGRNVYAGSRALYSLCFDLISLCVAADTACCSVNVALTSAEAAALAAVPVASTNILNSMMALESRLDTDLNSTRPNSVPYTGMLFHPRGNSGKGGMTSITTNNSGAVYRSTVQDGNVPVALGTYTMTVSPGTNPGTVMIRYNGQAPVDNLAPGSTASVRGGAGGIISVTVPPVPSAAKTDTVTIAAYSWRSDPMYSGLSAAFDTLQHALGDALPAMSIVSLCSKASDEASVMASVATALGPDLLGLLLECGVAKSATGSGYSEALSVLNTVGRVNTATNEWVKAIGATEQCLALATTLMSKPNTQKPDLYRAASMFTNQLDKNTGTSPDPDFPLLGGNGEPGVMQILADMDALLVPANVQEPGPDGPLEAAKSIMAEVRSSIADSRATLIGEAPLSSAFTALVYTANPIVDLSLLAGIQPSDKLSETKERLGRADALFRRVAPLFADIYPTAALTAAYDDTWTAVGVAQLVLADIVTPVTGKLDSYEATLPLAVAPSVNQAGDYKHQVMQTVTTPLRTGLSTVNSLIGVKNTVLSPADFRPTSWSGLFGMVETVRYRRDVMARLRTAGAPHYKSLRAQGFPPDEQAWTIWKAVAYGDVFNPAVIFEGFGAFNSALGGFDGEITNFERFANSIVTEKKEPRTGHIRNAYAAQTGFVGPEAQATKDGKAAIEADVEKLKLASKAMISSVRAVGQAIVDGMDMSAILGSIVISLRGDVSKLKGDITGLWGDVSQLSGLVTGLTGDCTEISGDCTDIPYKRRKLTLGDQTNADINVWVEPGVLVL
jgi:hypothetical protein